MFSAQKKDIHKLVEAQRAHFLTGVTRPVEWRKERILTLKKLFEDHWPEWEAALIKDLGKKKDAITFESSAMFLPQLDYLIANVEQWMQPVRFESFPSLDPVNDTVLLVKEPLGVTLNIAPWNAPLFSVMTAAYSFVAGCTLVYKPSELAPATSELTEKLVSKYYDPKEFVIINGGIPETTELLKERFDHIFYTGNPTVAKIIMAAASKHLTPVTLELGGKNPVLIDDTADVEEAVKKVLAAKSYNHAQSCVCADYILVTPKAKPKLIEAMKKGVSELGDPHKMFGFGKVINERHFDRLLKLTTTTKGKLIAKQGEPNREKLVLPIHVYEVCEGDILLEDEIFGTVLPILGIESFEKGLKYIRKREKPLGAYCFTTNTKHAERFIKETSSGGATINDIARHCGHNSTPFGGVGNSGMGRANGRYAFDMFTHEKPVAVLKGLSKDIKYV